MTAIADPAAPCAAIEPGSVEMSRRLLPHELRVWVGRLGADLGRICGYQLGIDPERDAPPATGGKLVRPALALCCAAAAGGSALDAVPAGVAVELIHNASLVHDDIMDGDEYRRHRPTVWKQFGVSNAILAGDALIGLAFEALTAGAPAMHAGAGAHELARAVRALAIGQGDDLRCEARPTTSTDECLALIAGKTGALLGVACRLGARFGGAGPACLDAFERFGQRLGIAFQLVDDLLGIWGDPELTGKPVGADVRSRKSSAPVVAALHGGGRLAGQLRALYTSPRPMTDDDVATATELIERAGGRRWALDESRRHIEQAWDDLDAVPIDVAARAELELLADYVVAGTRAVIRRSDVGAVRPSERARK
jgi:geranylgeranyl diphosphate synthase, type I